MPDLKVDTTTFSNRLAHLHSFKVNTPRIIVASTFSFLLIVHFCRIRRRRTPKLKGPPRESFIFGVTKEIDIEGLTYENWERCYGPVYEIPNTMGTSMVVLNDPRAIAHFLSNSTTTYWQPTLARARMGHTFGNMLFIMEGEAHKRIRRALSYAFSVSAIRNLSPVFLDAAYKLKAVWDSSFQSPGDSLLFDVQKWLNYVSLDSIGIAGFSHDFGALTGHHSPVTNALDSFAFLKPSFSITFSALVGPFFPNLFAKISNPRRDIIKAAIRGVRDIAADLLRRAEEDIDQNKADRSIVTALVRSKTASSNIQLSADEILAQGMFVAAGYEMTALAMMWAFIELARHVDIQETLRAELLAHYAAEGDPTYDQLSNDLPYLDAFMCEVLRLRPPQGDVKRVAVEDDIIPLTQPIQTASGQTIDKLFISKGTEICVPVNSVNRSETFWGPGAGTFNPERWLANGKEKQGRWKEIQGYRHLLSFSDGPRACIGRTYAIAEIKSVLSVLVRNFIFEFPDGPSTRLGTHLSLMPRPKVVGEDGWSVPMTVRKVI